MIELHVNNETGFLKTVVLGTATDFGGTPEVKNCYDPKSKEHVLANTFPIEGSLVQELDAFFQILDKYNVKILRPYNIKSLNQIFTRDIAFVINNKIIVSNIIENRKKELLPLKEILKEINNNNIVSLPEGVNIEGGDVILYDDYIFVGYSKSYDFNKYLVARTNELALDFLRHTFPDKIVKGFELVKSDEDAMNNCLHLDCCFQPIGKNMAIIFEEGFKNKDDVDFLNNLFGVDNLIKISKQEMYSMYANVFSISEQIIVSDNSFVRLNKILRKKGFVVEELTYSQVAKMEGLLRCSTLPLERL